MPSFLSKVFGRKRSEEKESSTSHSIKRISNPSLLEGKFEAVPSTISPSPSTPRFPEGVHPSEKSKDREGDKGGPFALLRSRPKPQPSSLTTNTPHLTLRLPGTIDKNGGSLVASFNPQADETGGSISTRRLTPAETLLLIEACSKAITERGGLETLGVMRPHWHSASPHLQRKLISLFILSLAHKGPETTLAPSTSPLSAFNSELEYTRSVHDVAAVFRWALRHLRLEGASFGSSSSSDEWSWYNNFSEAERKSSYHPRVFTTKLVPEIPSAHITLLKPTLDIISSLAAHAEANGYSGSKLTKYFGFWLLAARRAAGTEDWHSFYARWEASGRMLEHLFLSWLRDENTKRPLPRRLQELVAQYPYTTSPDPTADGLLTRPRFSTRRYDALFVRVEAVYADNAQIHSSPVGIFNDALKSESKPDNGGYVYLWDQVKAAAISDSSDKPLPAILSDDTINLFSLVSTDPKEQALLGISGPASTITTPLSPVTETLFSLTTNGNGVPVPVRKPVLSPSIPQSPKDWAEFSSAGFGETTISQNFASTLLDKDVETTEPRVQRKPSKQKQSRNTIASAEFNSLSSSPKAAPEELEGPKLVVAAAEIVQLDEAFIDFWRDAAVDPVSSDWPKFVVGELKHPLTPRPIPTSSEDVYTGSPISWIIIEEKFRRPTPPPTPVISHEPLSASGGLKVGATPLKRTSSPRPSFGEKKSSFSATLKRFTLFGSSKDDLTEDANSVTGGSGKKDSMSGKKRRSGTGKSPRIGEMGEVLSEEPEPILEVPEKFQKTESGQRKGAVVVGPKEVTKADATTKDDELPAPPQDAPAPRKRIPVPSPADRLIPEPAPSLAKTPASEPVVDEVIPEEAVKTGPETLPPAPESVVSHGETPGPQLALDSTEAGLHHPPKPETHVEPAAVPPVDDTDETVDFGIASREPTFERLHDKVEDPATDVGVDLDPVPIVPNDASIPPVTQPALAEPEPVNASPIPQPEERVATTGVVSEDSLDALL